MKVIAIIPARGGSKSIPRKNLRPIAGKPLIYYSISACVSSSKVSTVVVSTDDEEIALFAERFGSSVLMRPDSLADDKTTLDPVIAHALEFYSADGSEWDVVLTVQPTSPLITASDIDNVLTYFEKDEPCDSVISVVDDRHLTWGLEGKNPVPQYRERVNRQQLPVKFKETGAIIACRTNILRETGSRIGSRISLYEISHEKSFDIDTISDFFLCESLLQRKTITFVVTGNSKVGIGHASRSVMLANELVKHEVKFVVTDKDDLAESYISSHNYPVTRCSEKELVETIISIGTDLVVNDILDTSLEYVEALKVNGLRVVNFEDLGTGIESADLVINALYPSSFPSGHIFSGADYFCLRDEFLHISKKAVREDIEKVLICFGGVDEGNLTLRTIESIRKYCQKNNISIVVVLGSGYMHESELEKGLSKFSGLNINMVQSTSRISDYMVDTDLAFTSGGRTVLELAFLNVPTLVICQNSRELTHIFASSDNGVINLGHRDDIESSQIESMFIRVVSNSDLRQLMFEKLEKLDLSKGKKRVIALLESVLEASDE
jgi:CMP-N-acetylneuraminic acid synthetase/spore coat polysaccharide biosynthesis predicted glycosyltransferase SpsG